MAQNKHRFRSVVYLIIAIANVISTYILVPYMGAIGAALCSAVSYVIGQGFIMNVYYYKVIGINIGLFWKNILRMAITPLIMVIAGFLIKRLISFGNWPMFFVGVIVYSLLFMVLMWVISMNPYEKEMLTKPIHKIVIRK